MTTPYIGQGLDRVDGRDKVCGRATYAAEFQPAGLVHAVMVCSTIAHGRIARVDDATARAMPGVLAVISHVNAPALPQKGKGQLKPPAIRVRSLLQDDTVSYNGEPIAVVVADTFERATEAARRLRFDYEEKPAALDFAAGRAGAINPGQLQGRPADSSRGDLAAGLAAGAQKLELVYHTPIEHHNPMEPHATIAEWSGDKLTVHDSTQAITGSRTALAQTFGLQPEQVLVLCPFVGGGFGGKGSSWSHVTLAAMAAKVVGRPVKLVLERPQMFGPVGHRPQTEQSFSMAASADGALTALRHSLVSETSTMEDWPERSAVVTRMLYDTGATATSHRLVRLNAPVPTFTRAPGEATGVFALECAMDEMAWALGMDPIALRLRNYAEKDPDSGKPFSSKSLRACYEAGAARFGWKARDASSRPARLRDGDWQVGFGMSTCSYPANRSGAEALVRMRADGTALVLCGSQDLGTGTLTVMTQVAADAIGMPIDRVTFELGDSRMPMSPGSGGSQTAASVSPAVQAAGLAMRARLIAVAIDDARSPLHGRPADGITIVGGWLRPVDGSSRGEAINALVGRWRGAPLEVKASAAPGPEKAQFSMHSFGAVFVEARVDAELGIVRIPRVVGAYGVGNILNAKTARSQMLGGIVWGLGMALMEDSMRDGRYGRIVNASLGEYHVPVNADVGEIDVIFVPEDDPHINPLGVKGIGEIGITGVAAAVANAVFHATGKRVRDLPVTLDKLV